MIACPACGHDNPLGTRFCRSCGGKMEIKLAQVVGSIEQTRQQNREESILKAGRSALGLSIFLLLCAIILRAMVVPQMPVADLPAPDIPTLVPQSVGETQSTPIPLGSPKRLAWRHDNAGALIGSEGVDLMQVQTWQNTIAAAQKPDGSFPGDDPLAATGLAALALQAYPREDAIVAAAARARAWLLPLCKDLTTKAPLARTLALYALLDAEELPAGTYSSFSMYMVDGKAPVWQALGMALFTPKDRPQDIHVLLGAQKTPFWPVYFDLIQGKVTQPEAKPFFSEIAKGIATGEERMLWAFASWHLAAAPKDLTETLTAWSRAAPAPIDADTAAKCGANAAAAVAVLTVAAPARVQPLWLFPH
jgi:hypothetical protein